MPDDDAADLPDPPICHGTLGEDDLAEALSRAEKPTDNRLIITTESCHAGHSRNRCGTVFNGYKLPGSLLSIASRLDVRQKRRCGSFHILFVSAVQRLTGDHGERDRGNDGQTAVEILPVCDGNGDVRLSSR
jgi:hypothetical protein